MQFEATGSECKQLSPSELDMSSHSVLFDSPTVPSSCYWKTLTWIMFGYVMALNYIATYKPVIGLKIIGFLKVRFYPRSSFSSPTPINHCVSSMRTYYEPNV